MYKKLLLLLTVSAIFSGCGRIDYDGATRLIFEGMVTGPDGAPLQGINVVTNVRESGDSEDVGIAVTDSNGYYRMMFPKAKKAIASVHINTGIYTGIKNDAFNEVGIYNVDIEKIIDYGIDFGVTELYNLEDSVGLSINVTGEAWQLNRLIILGKANPEMIDYDFDATKLEPNSDYYPFSDTIYSVAKNQVVLVKYLLRDGITRQVEVPVGDEDLTYNLNL